MVAVAAALMRATPELTTPGISRASASMSERARPAIVPVWKMTLRCAARARSALRSTARCTAAWWLSGSWPVDFRISSRFSTAASGGGGTSGARM